MAATTSFKVSRFIQDEMSGSAISDHDGHMGGQPGGGYDPLIAQEYNRPNNKDRFNLTANALRDLAEFLEAMTLVSAQNGNTAGARSCETHRARALAAARELEAAP